MAKLYETAQGINQLEQLAEKDSIVHRIHPMAKLVTTIVYIIVVISYSSRNVSGSIPFLFYPVIMMSLSDTPYRPVFKRLLIALPFSLMGGISNLLFAHDTFFYIGTFAVTYGMVSFVSIILKTLLCVFAILILMATTSFVEICYQLSRLGIPKILCLQLVMTYRYLSVLISETSSMYTAYSLRAPNQRGIKMKHMGSFLGQLLLRSFDRADRVYHSMKCRGFQGVYRGNRQRSFCLYDGIYVVLLIGSILILRFYNLSQLFGKLAG